MSDLKIGGLVLGDFGTATASRSFPCYPEWANRALDLAGAIVLLAIFTPLMLVLSILIRLDSPGPAIYRQVRAGRDGRPFVMLKFRSMRTDAESLSGPQWAHLGDPRVTRLGGLLRRCRADELPQLINVLRGDMSLVGPRPERPHFVRQLAAALPDYDRRLAVRPGLTGWAQVNLPYGASVEDAAMKLSYDLDYLARRSVLFDLFIMLITVPVVLFGRGAR